ncbi:hypothetical protein PIB30_086929 [Stylosanthes scabra]|uniref:Uncharacterized protein n=1 Tax=Stylosanthes scabra TaxID=79078 RepID=A0ABU6UW01_9FABA|nr:hypothetical protein [Stylosanthes scabra]
MMGLFDIALFHRVYFGYENGRMRFMHLQKIIIEDNDNDLCSLYETEEYLMHFGYPKDDIAALWYNDPLNDEFEIAINGGNDEGFPEIGWMDVGGINRDNMRELVRKLMLLLRKKCLV